MNTKQLDEIYIANTYKRADLVLKSGKGSLLYDEAGREYIDFSTGIAVNAFGVADDEWMAAVTAQLGVLPHCSNLYYSSPQTKLAELLCSRTGMKKVFFANSGAEANECLIKVARKYGSDRYGELRPNIITLYNSFHGRTVTTLSATGQDHYHQHFGPFTPGFLHIPAGDTEGMRAAIENGDVCAVLMEMVQGEGGVVPLEKTFVQEVAALCDTHDVLFMVDEVQTGNGRTGSLYAYMQYGVMPDAFSTAKALAGGLPFGAAVLGEKLEHTLGYGDHGSTFGGNPVCAAGAYSILSRIDDALLTEIRHKEAYIRGALLGAKGVKGVTGLGLMLGIECDKPAGEVVAACLDRGVVVLTAKAKVRLLPALNIPMELLIKGIDIIKEAIAE